jgi:hypothetical protein
MRRYWGKIILGALLIFAVGFAVISAGRSVKHSIVTNKDITIPLGSFVGFKLDGIRVGSIRQIRIRRSEPRVLAGFDVRVRLTDTAAFTRLQNCRLSVNETQHFDDRTSFLCLPSDSGYESFGEVTAYLSDPDQEDPTLVLPLLLPSRVVAEIRRSGDPTSPGGDKADSIAAELGKRARVLERQYEDSVTAAGLDKRSAQLKARADSIRARQQSAPIPPAGPVPPTAGNPKPL